MSDDESKNATVGCLIKLKDNVYTSEGSDSTYSHPAIYADFWYGWFALFFPSGSLGIITNVNEMGARVYLFKKSKTWFFFHNEYQVVSDMNGKKIPSLIMTGSLK